MQTQKIILGLGLLLSFAACNNAGNRKEVDMMVADSATAKSVSSSAAVENGKDTTHKFVRTADLKFKVKSVIKSTYDIEDITNQQGGFVTYTNLTSNVNNVSTTAISADSSLETTNYLVTNTITLRVPNTKLDTTLKEISRNIDFLDYRIIKAEDVALSILSNNLAQKRAAKNEERLTNAIDNKGKKLNETTVAEEVLLSKQEQADNAKISNLSLKDQINFSTIKLSIYQRETIKREVISNDKNITAYEPGFGSKFLESLKFGWEILESFIIFLTKFWGLFLFVVVVYFLYKKYGHKLKK
jgi:Domain of unknown function (DUF4349)